MRTRERLAQLPLRVRLVAAVLVLVVAGLSVAGLGSTYVLRDYLVGRVDDQLSDATPAVLATITGTTRGPYAAGPQVLRRFYVLVSARDGSSEPIVTADEPPRLPVLDAAEAARRSGRPFDTGSVEGGGRWRVLVTALPNGESITLAQPLGDVEGTVARLVRVQVTVGLGVLALLAAMAYALVARSLRPLREVEQTAAAIAGGDLSLRVPRQHPGTEVGRLALAFNSMLGRIEAAFRAQEGSEAQARASEARLRQFVADASHELRTPLTSIRGFAELYRAGAVPPGEELDRVMGRVEGEATRMGQLVEEMLLLARLDQQRPLQEAPVDLLRLASDAVQDARATDPERPVRLEAAQDGEPPVVLGDEPRLRQVLVNLVGNALAHTPPRTPVTVRLHTERGLAVVEVRDEGPGLAPADASRVFERFYRADVARSRAQGGSGLGLSIVRAVVEAHGGRVGVRSTPGSGASFVVEVPLAAAGRPVSAGTPAPSS